MRFLRFVGLLGLISTTTFAQAKNADLEKATQLIFDQEWQPAAKVLETAWRQPNNKREMVLRILELQGVVYAQLGQDAKARTAFQTLLALDAKRDISGKYSERVQKALMFAQSWAKANPALELAAEPAAVDPSSGRVMQIAVKLKGDPLKLARKVRFSIRPENLKWSDVDVELQGAYATAGTDAEGLEWYADLLGERDMILASVGSRAQPVAEGKSKKEAPVVKADPVPVKKNDAPVAKADPPPSKKVEPEPKIDDSPDLVVPEESSGSALKPVGYVLIGAGVAAAAAGIYFGIQVQQARSTLENPTLDANGNITSPTQARAYELERSVPRNAIIANSLFGAAGALAVAGGICVIVGSTQTTVAPGAGGIVVSGKF